jgi:hypothetical protein
VAPTHPAPPSDSRFYHHNLDINCIVFGDDPSHVFTIEIEGTKNVSALKEAIKDKMRPAFDHVPAHILVLWKVCVAVDGSLNENLSDLDLRSEQPLRPLDELSEVFLDRLARKHLHILVQRPPTRE